MRYRKGSGEFYNPFHDIRWVGIAKAINVFLKSKEAQETIKEFFPDANGNPDELFQQIKDWFMDLEKTELDVGHEWIGWLTAMGAFVWAETMRF